MEVCSEDMAAVGKVQLLLTMMDSVAGRLVFAFGDLHWQGAEEEWSCCLGMLYVMMDGSQGARWV